ncbi:hypothetical protein Tco_1370346 [Tanacetum coccineum]
MCNLHLSGINDFFLDSDEDAQIGMSRVAADPDSDDKVLAEILFRGKSISVLVETGFCLCLLLLGLVVNIAWVRRRLFWDKAVEDVFSSEQNRRRKYFTYLKQLLPHVYREDILLLRRRMNSCYPKSLVHVLDLTNGKTVYMFVDKIYPIRATLLERMLRHKLTVPPSYDAADEENAAAHEAAGSTAEAHPEPHSPPVSPVRELTPERQPETEWVVPNPVSPVTDWRPWPSVPAHSPIRDPTPEPASPPTPPAQTFMVEEPLVFGPAPRPTGDVDPDVFESIIFGPQPRPHGYVDPDFVEPIIFGPHPRPDNYLEPEDLDNLLSMEDDTTHGGFHVESPVRPDDAPTPTADAAGRAEDPVLLTSLSEKLDRCMGRIDSLETELGTTKKIMGGAILTLVSRVKKLEKTVKQLRTTQLVGDVPASEGDVDIQDDVDIDGLSRMASAALGPDQTAVPSENVEEREEEEVPLRRKRSAYRRARTAFSTPAFEQFQAHLSAGPSVAADKGKAPMPDLDIPAEFIAEDAQARKRFEAEQASERLVQQLQAEALAQEYMPNVSEDELMMRMTETDWLNLMMQVGSNPALARELLGADVTEDNFIERMTAIKDKKKRALVDLCYRALKGKPMKQSKVTQMMHNLVKNQWCAAHNGIITMTAVKAMTKQQLIEEYEYICSRLEKDRLLSAQYNLFRPKPAITEPPSKRQRVEHISSPTVFVPAVTTHTADDPDSAGGGGSNPAGSAFGTPVTDSTVPTPAAMDSAGSHHEIGISPFADSADSSSPSNVSTDHIPIDGLFVSTSGGINDFFLDSDEDAQIGMSRVAADPDSDDEVLAEILFWGKYISGAGVVVVDKLPDDEIVDPRVKVETVSDYASSPPRSESESDDDMEHYIPPLPYGEFQDWEMVSCPPGNSYIHVYYQQNRRRKYFTYLKQLLPHVYREDILLLRRRMNRYFRLNPDVNIGLDLWRDVNMLCQSLHSDDVEDFWRTQDDWIVSSWQLYPKSSVHVLDLTNGKIVYMFVDKVYPIRATLLERMLRHRLTVPLLLSDVVVARDRGRLLGKRPSQHPLDVASYEELASPEQTAPGKDVSIRLYGYVTPTRVSCCTDGSVFLDVAASFDSAVHRVMLVSFAAAMVSAGSSRSVPADYVPAGHVIISADRYREYADLSYRRN